MGTTCNLLRGSLWHSSMVSKNQRDCSRLSSNTKLEFRFFDRRFEATWVHHSAANRWSYPGSIIQVDSRAQWLTYHHLCILLLPCAQSCDKFQSCMGQLAQEDRSPTVMQTRQVCPSTRGTRWVNSRRKHSGKSCSAKPLHSPNYHVLVSIISWRIRQKWVMMAVWFGLVWHRVGRGSNLLPDQSETTWRSSQLKFLGVFTTNLLSFETAVRKRTTWISLPSSRAFLDCPEALQVGSQTWSLFLHGFLLIVCPDSNALWINVVHWNRCFMRFRKTSVWSAVLLPLSPEEQTAPD